MWRKVPAGDAMSRCMAACAIVFVVSAAIASGETFAQADWTQRTPSASPTPRSSAAMSELGSNVVLFGGQSVVSGGTVVLGDTWVWNGTNWSQITSFGLFGTGARPSARRSAVMAYHPNANVAVLFGGRDANGTALNDTWVLTRTTNARVRRTYYEWTQVTATPMPPARVDTVMQFDASSNSLILATGFSTGNTLSDTWSFNPGTRTWSQATTTSPTPLRANAAMARCSISATQVADRLVLFGGFETGAATANVLGDTWAYRTNQFPTFSWGQSVSAPQPPARFRHAMAFYPVSNQAVLYGGGAAATVFSDTWNGFCGSWSQANPTRNPGQRNSMSMAYSAAGMNVVMFGGRKVVSGAFQDSNETWTWGRRAACLPADGAVLRVGSKVVCQFDQVEGVAFKGWVGDGFAPRFPDNHKVTFHTNEPGAAYIEALWTDESGSRSQTYSYTIVRPGE